MLLLNLLLSWFDGVFYCPYDLKLLRSEMLPLRR